MAKFSKTVVTNSGISTIETAIAQSKPVIFTTVKSGSGTHQESENLKLATELKEEKQSFPVAEAGTTGKGQIKVRSDITNANLQIGYYINEIGIYAKVEGGQEVLFGITSAIFADYLPDEATAPATIITEFYIQVENAENITFTYEFPQDVYATKEELEFKLDKKDAFSKNYNDLSNKPTALKNPQSISINGKTYDGSATVNTGTQGIAYGGTGATTASAARTALGLGTAAVKGVANNLTTTEDGFLLDAKQGKVINESLTEINQSLNGTLRFLDYANSKEVTLSNFTATEDGYLFPTNVYGSSGEVAYMTVNNKTLWVSNFHGIQKRFDFPSLPLRVGDIVKIFNAPFDTNSGYFVPFTK